MNIMGRKKGAVTQGNNERESGRSHKWHIFFLLVIAALATFTRLYHYELTEFKIDEAHYPWTAKHFWDDGVWPTWGITSANTFITQSPMYTYFIIFFSTISLSPMYLSAMIAVANAVGVVVMYLFLRRFFTSRAAVFASLLFAVNPWAVLFSRKLWIIELSPVFALLFMYVLYHAIFNRKPWAIAASLGILGILMQFHLTALHFGIFIPIILVFALRLNMKAAFCIGMLLLLVTFVPWGIFNVKHPKNLERFVEYSQRPSSFDAAALSHVPNYVTTLRMREYSLGGSAEKFQYPALDFIDMAVITAYLCAVIFALSNAINRKFFLLLAWLLPLILLFTVPKSHVPMEYFIHIIPVQFIILGIFLDALYERHPILKPAVILFVLIIVAYQIGFVISFYEFIDREKNINGDYGMPLKYQIQALAEADNATLTSDYVRYSSYAYVYDYYLKKSHPANWTVVVPWD